jgi:hypothetical protein
MALPRVTLEMIRGEDVDLQFTVTDANGTTVNISAWTDVRFTLRRLVSTSALVERSIVSGGISALASQATAANTGKGTISLSTGDTLALTAGTYYYDLVGIDASGNRDTLIAPSKLVLEQGCTE